MAIARSVGIGKNSILARALVDWAESDFSLTQTAHLQYSKDVDPRSFHAAVRVITR
jgi:hypothetical protein